MNNTKIAGMLELSDKNFGTAMIKVLLWAITYMLEANENIQSFSKEI